jgi:hypothetical protein
MIVPSDIKYLLQPGSRHLLLLPRTSNLEQMAPWKVPSFLGAPFAVLFF